MRRVALGALLPVLCLCGLGVAAGSAGAAGAAPARLMLALHDVHGRPAFAFRGSRIDVHGTVIPYVAGQKVTVSFYRGSHRVRSVAARVARSDHGVGRFVAGYASSSTGSLTIRIAHAPTAGQAGFSARPLSVQVINPDLSAGARGSDVYLLQRLLSHLHYSVPVSGYFDDATGRALIAYRKMTSGALVPVSDAGVFVDLARGLGTFHVRFARDGKHVEADLSRQVLAEIDRGGRVHLIYTMSSGKPSTPTVVGHFHVYLKDFGTNGEGMVDSNYFIGGYAIHGYADVPTYAASHGCLRIPIPDAPAVYGWVSMGDAVDVYFEGGGGSHHVQGNAGP